MAYEFKTLGSVEALTEVPENANALVEVDGAIKRVPGGALGGSGGEIFVLQRDPETNVFSFNEDASLKIIDIIVQGGFPAIILNVDLGDGNYDSGRVTALNFYHGSAHGGSGDFLTLCFAGNNFPSSIELMLENNVFTSTAVEPS